MSTSTEVRSRPILFSGPMVRAILEGRKTQTRRVVKPQPFIVLSAAEWHARAMSGVDPYGCRPMGSHVLEEMAATCPHGSVGDLLWVRESFREVMDQTGGYAYLADCPLGNEKIYKWKPSIHMPRSASRLTLEITGVRVERLQRISASDCEAEGTPWMGNPRMEAYRDNEISKEWRRSFSVLWQSINGPESWAANPWVWVIAFRRVQQ